MFTYIVEKQSSYVTLSTFIKPLGLCFQMFKIRIIRYFSYRVIPSIRAIDIHKMLGSVSNKC